MTKNELIRDLCSVEFRTKSETRRLVDEYEKSVIKKFLGKVAVITTEYSNRLYQETNDLQDYIENGMNLIK